jgi:uncharacterized protein YkwD
MAVVLVRTHRNERNARPPGPRPKGSALPSSVRAAQRRRLLGRLGLVALAINALACRPSRSSSPPSYPPGYPPGGYPTGSYPPGSYPPGSYPPGSYPPGSYPPGSYPPGATNPSPPAPTAPPNAPPATWGLPLPPGFVLPPPIAWFPTGPWPTPPGTTPAPPPGSPPPAGGTTAGWSSLEQEVLTRVNAQRAQGAQCGNQAFGPAAPLEPHPALHAAARGHSADMAANDYFDHTSRDGRTMATRVRAAGYAGGAIGENIAAGGATAEAAVAQWVKSPGHCANLMSREFRYLGVGHAQRAGTRFGHYWTQNFGG